MWTNLLFPEGWLERRVEKLRAAKGRYGIKGSVFLCLVLFQMNGDHTHNCMLMAILHNSPFNFQLGMILSSAAAAVY